MNAPTLPWFWSRTADPARLLALAAFDLTDPQLRRDLDAVAAAAAEATGHPKSVINMILTDVQMAVGAHGLDGWVARAGGTPAEWAFCLHVVLDRGPFVVPDARLEPRVADSPLTLMGLSNSYTGVPVVDPVTGAALGALCVIDDEFGACTEADVPVLNAHAGLAAGVLERSAWREE
ncbi:MAG: GAF domain-containing protein [Kineosporiaceae bacterium]